MVTGNDANPGVISNLIVTLSNDKMELKLSESIHSIMKGDSVSLDCKQLLLFLRLSMG